MDTFKLHYEQKYCLQDGSGVPSGLGLEGG